MTNKKRIEEFLESATEIYAVPIYLIEELQDKYKKGHSVEELGDSVQIDIEALEEFQRDLYDQEEDVK